MTPFVKMVQQQKCHAFLAFSCLSVSSFDVNFKLHTAWHEKQQDIFGFLRLSSGIANALLDFLSFPNRKKKSWIFFFFGQVVLTKIFPFQLTSKVVFNHTYRAIFFTLFTELWLVLMLISTFSYHLAWGFYLKSSDSMYIFERTCHLKKTVWQQVNILSSKLICWKQEKMGYCKETALW